MLGNTPRQRTDLRLEARKSFALGIWVKDSKGRAVDLSGSTLTIVSKRAPFDVTSDDTNILINDTLANIQVPSAGYGVFTLQAASLDVAAGEYPYVIVLTTDEGYTSVLVKGSLLIEANPEYASVAQDYSGEMPTQSITAMMLSQNEVSVIIDAQLPPGMNYVRDDLLELLEEIAVDSIALVPEGGHTGYVLTKTTATDFDMQWRPQGNGAFALDATAQPSGHVPVAVGDGTWTWDVVGVDATDVPEGYAPLADGANGWAWGPVAVDIPTPDWNADPETPGEILNKPALGTAAAHDEEDFLAADVLFINISGVHVVTSVPVSFTDDHLYFVYEP